LTRLRKISKNYSHAVLVVEVWVLLLLCWWCMGTYLIDESIVNAFVMGDTVSLVQGPP
jgi:hypothetical protein